MATQWIEADAPGLLRLVFLVEDFWRTADPRYRRELEAQIERGEQKFGLSPIDRRRLDWAIAPPEQPEASEPEPTGTDGPDPRALLRVVR